MAERKSGPVKPPMIDLEARPAHPKAKPASGAPAEAPGEALAAMSMSPAPAPEPVASAPEAQPHAAPETAEVSADSAAPSDSAKPEMADTVAPAATGAAKESSGGDRAAEPVAATEEKRSPPPPPPPPPPRMVPATRRDGIGPAGLAASALVGGALGVAVSLGLASAGLWPQNQPDARLVRLYEALPAIESLPDTQQRLGALEAGLATQSEQLGGVSSAQSALETELAQGLDRVTGVAEAARFDPATLPPPDLSGLRTDITALSARIDAIAAGASPTDASAMGESLAALEQRLSAAEAALAATEARADETEARLAELTPAPTQPASADLQQTLDAQLRLPLLLSGLEAALVAGRPFASELQALAAIRTDLSPSAALAGAAAMGLPRPDTLSARFESLLPAIIAAGTQTQTGDWVSDALSWGRALLALRPAAEQAGDTPEAVLSRLEAAIARRDYAAARDLFAALPVPMQEAAAPLPAEIAALAEADALVAALRAGATTETPS